MRLAGLSTPYRIFGTVRKWCSLALSLSNLQYGSHQYVLSKEQLVSGRRGDKTSFALVQSIPVTGVSNGMAGWGNTASDLLSDSVIQKPAVAAMGQSGVKQYHQIE